MANVISVKVDVRKLLKERFFEGKADKNGHRPLYADLVLLPRKEPGQYNDTHMVKQSKKKDEEIDLPIIGNATERGAAAPKTATVPQMPPAGAPDSGEIPF
jgi:hypothetical protein